MEGTVLFAGVVLAAAAAGVLFYTRAKKEEKSREVVVSEIDEILQENSLDRIKEKMEELKKKVNGNSFKSEVKTHFNEIWLAVKAAEEGEVKKLKEELQEFKRKIQNT